MWVSIMSMELHAQFAQKTFDALERDSEITRVTLENHLKNWNDAPLLNKIKTTEVEYLKGTGLAISIDAPNSRIFLENGVKWSFKEDFELLDTFYDEDVIDLQQERLVACISQFITDFYTYLPTLPANESYIFEVTVDDEKNENASAKAMLRKYKLTLKLKSQDIDELSKNNGETKNLIQVEKEQL